MCLLKWRRWIQVGLVAFLCASPPPSGAATVLTVSSWAPPGHLLREGLAAWCGELQHRSGGRVVCDLLDESIAPVGAQLDIVERAAVDVALVVHSLQPERFVLTRLAELPLAGSSTEKSSVAFFRIWKQYLRRHDEHGDAHVLSVFTQAPGQLFTTARPVASLADLSGRSVRAGGGVARQVLGAFSPLGIREVDVPLAASVHAVADHKLDGMLATAENILRYGLQHTLQYQWELPGGLYRHSFSLVINEQVWQRLGRQDKAVLSQVSGETAARLFGRAADLVEASLQTRLAGAGVMVTQASPEQVRRVHKRVRLVRQAWITAARDRGLDNAARVLAAHQRLLGR